MEVDFWRVGLVGRCPHFSFRASRNEVVQGSCLGAVIGICTWGGERISPLNSIVLLSLLGSVLSIIDIVLSSHCYYHLSRVNTRHCFLVICISHYQYIANVKLQPTCVNHTLMTQISQMTMSSITWGGFHPPSRDIIIVGCGCATPSSISPL